MSKDKIKAAEQEPQKTQNITLKGWFEDEDHYEKPEERTFENIVGHQIGQHWIAVMTDADTTLIFKAYNIFAIRVWKE